MWPKEYKDYPPNAPLKKERVEPGHGIIGCEMSEPNGWGNGEKQEDDEPEDKPEQNPHL